MFKYSISKIMHNQKEKDFEIFLPLHNFALQYSVLFSRWMKCVLVFTTSWNI